MAEHSPVITFVEVSVYVDEKISASVLVKVEAVIWGFPYYCCGECAELTEGVALDSEKATCSPKYGTFEQSPGAQ